MRCITSWRRVRCSSERGRRHIIGKLFAVTHVLRGDTDTKCLQSNGMACHAVHLRCHPSAYSSHHRCVHNVSWAPRILGYAASLTSCVNSTYWMAGLAHDPGHYFKFLFILVLYTLIMTLFVRHLSSHSFAIPYTQSTSRTSISVSSSTTAVSPSSSVPFPRSTK